MDSSSQVTVTSCCDGADLSCPCDGKRDRVNIAVTTTRVLSPIIKLAAEWDIVSGENIKFDVEVVGYE